METRGNEKDKISKEERAERRRNDRIAREKDRERKRAKRSNPAYRQMEQERDRERKKVLRSDVTFRTLEKVRDRMRKERKRFCNELGTTSGGEDVVIIGESLIEPEVILSTSEYPQHYQQQLPCDHLQIPEQYNSSIPNETPPPENSLQQ